MMMKIRKLKLSKKMNIFDSVGGLLIGELGRFPEQNEEITLNNIKFTVEEIDKNRVKKVRIFT